MGRKEQLKTNNNVVYSCKYHVIWCPKYRRPVLVDAVAKRLKTLIRQQAGKYRADLLEMEVMPDHVHLLVGIDPQYGIHRLVKNIKGYSSRILRREFLSLRKRLPTLWTNRYCVLTVGGATLAIIKRYIENQKNV
ncbi:MAG: IS200/IS605 family transposase [Thermodesulfovibrionales bacterium]|jgi:putative transposase